MQPVVGGRWRELELREVADGEPRCPDVLLAGEKRERERERQRWEDGNGKECVWGMRQAKGESDLTCVRVRSRYSADNSKRKRRLLVTRCRMYFVS